MFFVCAGHAHANGCTDIGGVGNDKVFIVEREIVAINVLVEADSTCQMTRVIYQGRSQSQ